MRGHDVLLPRTVAVALLVGSCLTAGILGTYLALRRPVQSGGLDQPPGLSGTAEEHAGAPPSGNSAGAGAGSAPDSATDASSGVFGEAKPDKAGA